MCYVVGSIKRKCSRCNAWFKPYAFKRGYAHVCKECRP
jgi:hypothetical protein